METVCWTDDRGITHSVETDATDAKALFTIIVRTAIRGKVMDVIHYDANHNCIDSWGT